MDIREEFEKLTEIAEILNRNGGGYYKERTNDYHHCNLYFDKFFKRRLVRISGAAEED